jgi:hypothetical protein
MMGPKKLSTIRQELKQALSRTGNDPIKWLEERIRATESTGQQAPEVLQSLRRLFKTPRKARPKRSKKRIEQ